MTTVLAVERLLEIKLRIESREAWIEIVGMGCVGLLACAAV